MKTKTAKELIEFENHVESLWLAGELPSLFHLSGGNEDELIEIFDGVRPGDWILSSHRNHYHYLLTGGDPQKLLRDIKDGLSMFIFDREVNFLSSSILAGMCSIAAGISLANKMLGLDSKVFCFLGDAASEQGHFYEAVKYVESENLPCLFIVEDNDRSCDTTKKQRGSHVDIISASCVLRYNYKPTYPHCQAPSASHITFKDVEPRIVNNDREGGT
jgi:pyruvate dehydrogenase E1 component alpha subunit